MTAAVAFGPPDVSAPDGLRVVLAFLDPSWPFVESVWRLCRVPLPLSITFLDRLIHVRAHTYTHTHTRTHKYAVVLFTYFCPLLSLFFFSGHPLVYKLSAILFEKMS